MEMRIWELEDVARVAKENLPMAQDPQRTLSSRWQSKHDEQGEVSQGGFRETVIQNPLVSRGIRPWIQPSAWKGEGGKLGKT